MSLNYYAGTLAIVAGFIVLYYYYKSAKQRRAIGIYMLAIGIVELITGCIGICFIILDGINLLLFGITMFWFMSNEKAPSSGVSITMHNKGWIAAIGSIIIGILLILDHLNIFSLWRYRISRTFIKRALIERMHRR